MNRLGLSAADFNQYVAHLRSPSITALTEAHLLAMDGTVLESLGPVLGGQVNVDLTQTTQAARTGTVILSDPGHIMSFDSNSPASSAATVDRMLRLSHVTYVPALGHRVACPVITGPFRGFDRTGTEVTLSVSGRDDLMQGEAWRTRTYRKGEYKTSALKDLFQFYGGASAANLPTLGATLPTHMSLARTSVPWASVQSLAASLDRQVFFDANGDPQMRPHPNSPVLTVYEGDQGTHMSDVIADTQVSFALASGWFNVAQVTGAKPNIVATAYPSPLDALHPANMNSGGAWTVRLYTETNPAIRSIAEAKARAERLIAQQVAQTLSVKAVTKCFPFLEEGDYVRLVTKSGPLNFRLQQFSIDLAGVGMSLGYNARFTSRRVARPSRRLAR